MFKFENERQSGVKCVNVHCQFCMDDPGIVCDSVNGSSGDPSYADCLTYLPEKLIDNIESPNSAEVKPVSGGLPEYREHNNESFQFALPLLCLFVNYHKYGHKSINLDDVVKRADELLHSATKNVS